MDIFALREEIINDPLGRGYSGMNDGEVAIDINTEYRTRNRASMSGSEIWKNTNLTEFGALLDGADTAGKNERNEKQEWISFCAIDSHDPFGPSVQFVINLFGAGSATATNLNAARVETISRGNELGLGYVKVGHVEMARGA